MSDNEVPDARRRRNRRLGWGGGLLAAGAIGGAVLAGALPASAASPSPSTTSGSTSSGQPPAAGPEDGPGGGGPGAGGPGGGGQRSDETVLTGTLAAQAKAAAVKAVPGATVIRVETDADGATYEAHLKKADGSPVTVKLDKDMAVTAIQAGMGSMKPPTTTTSGDTRTGSGA